LDAQDRRRRSTCCGARDRQFVCRPQFLAGSGAGRAPTLAPVPPLKPVTRSSTIIAPVAIAHSAIRTALDAQAPRTFEGKQEKPITDLLNNSSISWTVERGPLSVATRDERLIISTPLTGAAHLSGQISNTAGNLVGALGGFAADNRADHWSGRRLPRQSNDHVTPNANPDLADRTKPKRPGLDHRSLADICRRPDRGRGSSQASITRSMSSWLNSSRSFGTVL